MCNGIQSIMWWLKMLLMIERFHTYEKKKQMTSLFNIMFQDTLFLHWSEGFNMKLTEHKDVEDSGSDVSDLDLWGTQSSFLLGLV